MTTLRFTPVAGAIFPSQDAPGIPPLADFAKEIAAELHCAEIARADFIDAVWDHAVGGALSFSPLTHAGCFLYEDGIGGDGVNAQTTARTAADNSAYYISGPLGLYRSQRDICIRNIRILRSYLQRHPYCIDANNALWQARQGLPRIRAALARSGAL